MKTFLIISLAIFGIPLAAAANDQKPVDLEDVCRAIGAGDIDQLSAVMDAEVELSILDMENLYSKQQAITALKEFFAEVSPVTFGKVHQGASKAADAEYCIGTLTTSKGPLKVYVYVAKRSGDILLQELRFERE